jgi:type IV pilus assembly protein PilY1
LFALDVSDPANFAAGAGVLFEFTDSDDAAIGHVLGAPRVVRIATASASGRSERAFVLAEAGVNGPAALFLIALDKAAGAWREGVNYFRVSAASLGEPQTSHLGPLALVNGNDGTLAHAWAGDAAGNLWRFSFTPDARAAGGFRADVTLVFKAISGQQLRQPITSPPRIAWASGSGYLVLFGTGKMLEHSDAAPASQRQESLYAIHDRLAAGAAPLARASLASRRAVQHEDGSWRVSGEPFSYGAQTRGWVLDLPVSGERVLSAPVLAGGRLHAFTQVVSGDPCLPIASRAWNVDVLSGLSDSAITVIRPGPALLRSPLVFQSGRAGVPDAFGRRSSIHLHSVLFQEPSTESGGPASAGGAVHKGPGPAGRLSWREIVDWKPPTESARAP